MILTNSRYKGRVPPLILSRTTYQKISISKNNLRVTIHFTIVMTNWDNIIVIERKTDFKVREKQEKLKEKRCDMKQVQILEDINANKGR